MEELSEALSDGVGFDLGDAKGRRFFCSTLVQTLFYGVFSAWVLWGQQPRAQDERFAWRASAELLHLPLLTGLFHAMTRPSSPFAGALRERLDLAEWTLNRVDREAFFKGFPEEEAVQYFYEPFLEAFDADLRRQLGVWYTPREVVHYMVERVDRALREQLGLALGLADPNVVVLDPACGTGAFYLAVLRRVVKTIEAQGIGATAAARLVEAVTGRIHGFEILPAPFVIAHLQVSLYLRRLGVTLPQDARVGIYLKDALTGWGRTVAAAQSERKAPVLVVLGNPPFNAFAGVQAGEEQESVDVYKAGLGSIWKVRKFNLDDLFVRFFRLAERKIAEQGGRGVVCFISSASYTADPSFVVMRERFLRQFDTITIDNLNGDSRETGKTTPDGAPDPSIFSTGSNREGIRVGTAIGLFVLRAPKAARKDMARVRWREFWGARKRQSLLRSLDEVDDYADVAVTERGQWSFRPRRCLEQYTRWASPLELCAHGPISGLAEKRRTSLIAMEKATLELRFKAYFDRTRSWEEVRADLAGLALDAACYPAEETRRKILAGGESFEEARVRRYALLPLDHRYCYHTNATPLWNRSRPVLSAQAVRGNRFLILRRAARQASEGIPALMVGALPDHHLLDPNVVAIPLCWYDGTRQANLSPRALAYLRSLGIDEVDEHAATLVWFHYLAIVHSPAYLADNGDAVRGAVPRVPLPMNRDLLEKTAALGLQVARLLDPDHPVDGVTTGIIDPALRALGVLRRVNDALIDPMLDLALTRRWGTLQGKTMVMPGPGCRTPSSGLLDHALGPKAWDVWLNEDVCWSCVPEVVWEFSIGGYQVVKKWLSYRDRSVLKRDLRLDEAEYVVAMIRRIAAVCLLSGRLDGAYRESVLRAGG